jgi:hypothetical protein
LALAERGAGDRKAASDIVKSPTVSSASFDTPLLLRSDVLSATLVVGSSGFGFDWKKPFKLFWPLAGAAFDVEFGAAFCFFVG